MGWVLLAAILAVLLIGLGFVVKWLFILAVIAVLAAIVGAFVSRI